MRTINLHVKFNLRPTCESGVLIALFFLRAPLKVINNIMYIYTYNG